MWILKIIKSFLRVSKSIPKVKRKFNIFSFRKMNFFKSWKKLSPSERDTIRKFVSQDKEVQRLKELSKNELQKVLQKDFTNQPLSTNEKTFLVAYEDLFVNDKEPMINKYDKNHMFDKANSSWISTVIYYPENKRVRLLIENKNGWKKWYNFYNVPKTKYLTLIEIGGKYMWDYFGKHYSLNPYRWIRKSEVGKVRVRKVVAK